MNRINMEILIFILIILLLPAVIATAAFVLLMIFGAILTIFDDEWGTEEKEPQIEHGSSSDWGDWVGYDPYKNL